MGSTKGKFALSLSLSLFPHLSRFSSSVFRLPSPVSLYSLRFASSFCLRPLTPHSVTFEIAPLPSAREITSLDALDGP